MWPDSGRTQRAFSLPKPESATRVIDGAWVSWAAGNTGGEPVPPGSPPRRRMTAATIPTVRASVTATRDARRWPGPARRLCGFLRLGLLIPVPASRLLEREDALPVQAVPARSRDRLVDGRRGEGGHLNHESEQWRATHAEPPAMKIIKYLRLLTCPLPPRPPRFSPSRHRG